MRSYIERRVEDEARYIIEHEATVRDTAAAFSVSKSTVHMGVTIRNASFGK